jgi:hypothetical protein
MDFSKSRSGPCNITEIVNSIDGTALKKVEEIKDLEVIKDGRMSFLRHFICHFNCRECKVLFSVFQESFVTRMRIKLCTLHNLDQSPFLSVHSERL